MSVSCSTCDLFFCISEACRYSSAHGDLLFSFVIMMNIVMSMFTNVSFCHMGIFLFRFQEFGFSEEDVSLDKFRDLSNLVSSLQKGELDLARK